MLSVIHVLQKGCAMPATEMIQIRVPLTLKRDLEDFCARKGVSLSEGARELLSAGLRKDLSVEKRLDKIFEEADERQLASGLPAPTVEEIVAYCDRMKEQRARAFSGVA